MLQKILKITSFEIFESHCSSLSYNLIAIVPFRLLEIFEN